MAKNSICSQAIIIEDRFTEKISHRQQYYVYMTAGANKFLRIYYGRVKEYLASLPESE